MRKILFLGLATALIYKVAEQLMIKQDEIAEIWTDEEDTLARTVWGEARGEGKRGMQAVACVVMNRVNSPVTWWGRTINSVCLSAMQFSCWNMADPNRPKVLAVTEDDALFRDALAIARQARKGALTDITNGATHYHTKAIDPYWAEKLTKTADISNHIFYA